MGRARKDIKVMFNFVLIWGSNVCLPHNVILMCISPMWAPMRAGNFSLENALYGVTTVVWLTCHDDPNRVTEGIEVYRYRVYGRRVHKNVLTQND